MTQFENRQRWTPTLVHGFCAASIALALGVMGCCQIPSSPEGAAVSAESMDQKTLDDHRAQVEAWHEERLTALRTDDGWLTLVGLSWLEGPENSIGSDPDGVVVLPPSAPDRLGTLRLNQPEAGQAGAVVLELADGQTMRADGEPVEGPQAVPLASDSAGTPTVVEVGTVSFFIIDRDGRLGVRIKDSNSDVRRDFSGIDRFPVVWDWRVEADYVPRQEPKAVEIPTALGTVSEMASPGRIRFERDGDTFELDAFATGDPSEVWFVFGDQTNTKTTYGGGRFVYAQFADGGGAGAEGKLVVDFNRAYNPPCVFTPFATCPLPTPENRLALAVEAGEKVYGSAAH